MPFHLTFLVLNSLTIMTNAAFDYFVEKYKIDDPAIQTIAVIVEGCRYRQGMISLRNHRDFGRSQQDLARYCIKMIMNYWKRDDDL